MSAFDPLRTLEGGTDPGLAADVDATIRAVFDPLFIEVRQKLVRFSCFRTRCFVGSGSFLLLSLEEMI